MDVPRPMGSHAPTSGAQCHTLVCAVYQKCDSGSDSVALCSAFLSFTWKPVCNNAASALISSRPISRPSSAANLNTKWTRSVLILRVVEMQWRAGASAQRGSVGSRPEKEREGETRPLRRVTIYYTRQRHARTITGNSITKLIAAAGAPAVPPPGPPWSADSGVTGKRPGAVRR